MATSRYSTRLAPILKNKTVTTYSPTAFSLIAIIIFAVFAIYPTIKTIIALQKTIDEQSNTLKNLKNKSEALSSAINNYNSISESTKIKLFTLLPNSTNATCLLSDINNMSASAQTSVMGIQVQSVDLKRIAKCILDSRDLEDYRENISPEISLNELSFTVNSEAAFGNLSNYLYLFNSSTRLVNIESVIFGKPGESPLSLIINGKAFFYK